MFYHTLDPVIANLGPLEIRWYGLMYVLTFILVYLFVRAAVKHKKIKLALADVDTLMVWLTIALVVGARIFEVLFYNPGYYFANPKEIIAVWHGGLSFHGGLAGVLLIGYIFARKKKVSFLTYTDLHEKFSRREKP